MPGWMLAAAAATVPSRRSREERTTGEKTGCRHPCPVDPILARCGDTDVLTRVESSPLDALVLDGLRPGQTTTDAWRPLEAARRVSAAGVALDDVSAGLLAEAMALVAADEG